jgi:hypothetical protein
LGWGTVEVNEREIGRRPDEVDSGKVVVEGCGFIANMKMPRDDSWSKEGALGERVSVDL